MSPTEVNRALVRSTGRVLETMCYAEPLPITGVEEGQAFLRAKLPFRGTYSGVFHLEITEDAGRSLATTFLGADEDVPAAQMTSVICELTNMICGSMLSTLDAHADIQLGAPEMVEDTEGFAEATVRKAFEIDHGQMAVAIQFN